MIRWGSDNFRNATLEELSGPSTKRVFWDATTDSATFTEENAPRFITVSEGGTLQIEDWSNPANSDAGNVVDGQILYTRPKKLIAAGSTAKVFMEW